MSGEKRKWAFFHFFRTSFALSRTLSLLVFRPLFFSRPASARDRSARIGSNKTENNNNNKTLFSSPFRRSETACTAARTRAARRSHECPPWPWACARPRRSATGSQAGQARGRRRGLRLEGFLWGERDRERERGGGMSFFVFRQRGTEGGGVGCSCLSAEDFLSEAERSLCFAMMFARD